jgi:NADH-quinone oxidoreductase subunit H
MKFGMFFVAEFTHAFTVGALTAAFFLGGWRGPWADQIPILGFIYLLIKSGIVYFFLLAVRFSLPRFRIDQMMNINWKLLAPLSIVSLIVTAVIAQPLAGFPAARTVALFVANMVVLWIFLGWAERKVTRKREIVGKPRPLATPIRQDESTAPQS